MKTKPHFIAALMLALFALTACFGKKTNADANALIADGEDAGSETAPMSEREKTDALMQAAEHNDTAKARRLIAGGAVLAVLLAAILLAVRRRKGDK